MSSRGGIILNKMLKAKKGISPILATLLLIVIAVAAVIVTYAWVMTFTTSTTSQAGALLSEANTRFYNTTTKYISITLLNSGTADAKMTKVYIGIEAQNLVDVTSTVDFTPDTNIVKANGGSINATWAYAWASGQRYYFKFITEAGLQYPFDRVAP
jgi:flagellin-like protein